MFFENLAFILASFQQLLLIGILVFSHKMVFIENQTVLLCVTMQERARSSTCSYNLVNNVLTHLLSLKSLVFVVHFSNAFWHGNEAFPKGYSQNQIVPLLVIFYLPYSKYRVVKICFYSCRYQNQNFPLASHSCRSCSTFVVLVLLVSGLRVLNQTRSFRYMYITWNDFYVILLFIFYLINYLTSIFKMVRN